MNETENQTTQPTIIQSSPVEEKKPSFTVHNTIALIFVVMILISWFLPVGSCRYNCPGSKALDIIALSMIIMGVVAGISFLVRVIKLTQGNKPVLRFFGILAGVGGGVFIFLVGLISGIIAGLRAHPT